MNLSDIDPVTFPTVVADSSLSRRSFLRLSAIAGGGFALALYLRGTPGFAADTPPPAGDEFSPSLFVRITPAGVITILATNPEAGQGVKTALPMIIAEELDAAWEQVTVVQAGLDARLGRQVAGGSRATPTHYDPFRKLGATARWLLVAAAAARWNVPAAELTTPGDARVVHAASGRSATYGELAGDAARLPLPADSAVTLKNPADFRIMGRRVSGVDNPQLVTGAPLFGLDVRRPAQVFATFVKCPVFGGVVTSVDTTKALASPGVLGVFTVKAPGVASGVAIIARSTWQAFKAREQLDITWDNGRTAGESSEAFAAAAARAWEKPPAGPLLRDDGDFTAAYASAEHTAFKARYTYPFLSHANLEPQNCTALFTADNRVEIWAPSQAPQRGCDDAAKALGLGTEAITVHLTRIGGGFGRRLTNDFVAEAAVIAREMPGTPVQLVWTRTDDMQHDWYRPAGFHELSGAVDATGTLVAWSDHFVTFAAGYDTDKVAGVASLRPDEFPSRLVPHCRIRQTPLPHGIPLGPWRAPRASAQCFAQQCFIDEIAHAAGRDPVAFRLALLGEPRAIAADEKGAPPFETGRMAGVVKLAAEKSSWKTPLPRGRGRGIAFHFSHLGYAAVVLEVTVTPEGELTVDRAVVAVDVGRQIINRSGAENQVEGSVVDGISSSLVQRITIAGGRTVQTGFGDMPLLRLVHAPRIIETHFLLTDNPPTGLGEPVIPPVPPALANALFSATGHRVRDLPLNQSDLSWS